MTSETHKPGTPVAISFTDYRNGEIADFFANENRAFQPDGGRVRVQSGQDRVVGRPHFNVCPGVSRTVPGQASVIFQPSCDLSRAKTGEKDKQEPKFHAPFNKQPRALASLLPVVNTEENSRAVSILHPNKLRGHTQEHGPSPHVIDLKQPATKLNVTLPKEIVSRESNSSQKTPEESLLHRVRDMDEKLGRLMEAWPRLPEELRESIASLVAAGSGQAEK